MSPLLSLPQWTENDCFCVILLATGFRSISLPFYKRKNPVRVAPWYLCVKNSRYGADCVLPRPVLINGLKQTCWRKRPIQMSPVLDSWSTGHDQSCGLKICSRNLQLPLFWAQNTTAIKWSIVPYARFAQHSLLSKHQTSKMSEFRLAGGEVYKLILTRSLM